MGPQQVRGWQKPLGQVKLPETTPLNPVEQRQKDLNSFTLFRSSSQSNHGKGAEGRTARMSAHQRIMSNYHSRVWGGMQAVHLDLYA